MPRGADSTGVGVESSSRDDRGDTPDPVLQHLSEVPPLPHVVRELIRELSDPQSSARSVARIAASDPALAAQLIRTVNSAAMGLGRTIASVAEAVSYLGYAAVRALVIRMRLQTFMPAAPGQPAYDAEDLWVHSLAVAYAADAIAARARPQSGRPIDRGFVSTLGLLHDIGKLAINSYFPDSAAKIRTRSVEFPDESYLDRERRVLGAGHAEIGAMLATHWKLPPDLVEAIRWHHAPQSAPDTVPPHARNAAVIVHAANQVAKYCYVYSQDMEIDIVPDDVLKLAGLPTPMARLLGADVRRAVSHAIFFIDQSSTRPLKAISRFVRLSSTGRPSADTMPSVTLPQTYRVAHVGIAFDDWLERIGRVPLRIDCSLGTPDRIKNVAHGAGPAARFTARVAPGTIERILTGAAAHLDTLRLPDDVKRPALFLLRRLLPNLEEIATGEVVDVIQCVYRGKLLTAVRSRALAFANRLPPAAPASAGPALLTRELANVINLRWFSRIRTTADGTAVLFRSLPVNAAADLLAA
ncbi:MAG TPA: HDOD domain-containing protein [Tepidisphaeraceae bacterium]|nr:HDOD domain-containing protein [Tepidisphaeraceae bacterium]